MRAKRAHGRILSVETLTRGSALAEDAAAGASSITVVDAGDFTETDDDGPTPTAANPLGWLTTGSQVVAYLACDDDTGVIDLAEPLAAAGEEGDKVAVWSELYEEAVEYQQALVELDGRYDNPEPVEAEVHEGVGELPEGDRGKPGESCTLKRLSADEWEIVAVGGRSAKSKGIRFEQDDYYTLTATDITAGTATMPLSHRPKDEALTCVLAGVPQRPTNWTIDYDAQTLTQALSGWEQAGMVLWAHYAYRRGFPRERIRMAATGTSSYDVPVVAPAASEGNLLLLAIALESTASVTALNGYTAIGETSSFTRTIGGVTQTYRLGVYARICPAGTPPVPTFTNVARDCPWAMAAVTGVTGIADSAVGVQANAHSATPPDVPAAALRAWAVLGTNPLIDVPGVVVAQNMTDQTGPVDQLGIVLTVDRSNGSGTVDTTDGTEAGDWMMASIAVTEA